MKKYKKYKAGGKVGFEDVAGLASAFVNPISAIPSALNLIGKLAYNPASYTPAKMNESPMGYNDGGDPERPKKGTQYKNYKKVKLGNIEFNPNDTRVGNEGEYLIVKDEKTGKDFGVVKDSKGWRFKSEIKDTPIGRMRNTYDTKEKEILDSEYVKNQLLYNPDDYIKISKGKDANLKVPKAVIDSAIVSAKKVNVDPNKLLGLMSRESSFGISSAGYDKANQSFANVPQENQAALSKKDRYVSAWLYDQTLKYPETPDKFLAEKGVPGISVNKTPRGYTPYVSDKKKVYNYLKNNPSLEKEYINSTTNFTDPYNGNALSWAAETIDKNPKSYNPGDPNYLNMLQKDINAIRQDENIQKYIKKRTPELGFAYGGDLDQQLSIQGGNDKQMGDHAVEVQGNPGVDTNYRNIGGQDVALTEGEIVRQDQDGSAYVWSNNPKMKHSSGETFAKAMKPVENKIAKIKRRIEKDPTDHIASTTLGHLEQIVEQNKNEEEMLRQAKGSPTAQAYNMGGTVKKYNPGGYIDPITPNSAMDIYINAALTEKNKLYGIRPAMTRFNPRTPVKALGDNISPTIQSGAARNVANSGSPFTDPKGFIEANPSPLTSVTGTGLPNLNDSLSTFEDKAFLGAKGLETVGRIANALQRPKQYDTRKYNVDKIKYNPNRVLDRNEANYQGSQFDINTGNANTDRILRNNLYGQKLQADRDVYREYDQMQRQSDLQVDQYNAQAMMNVDNINEQIQGRQQQARDAALTSIGNMASIFQQAGGAKAHNKITLATLNSLSKRYGIDVPNLMLLMEGQGDTNKGVVNYKGK